MENPKHHHFHALLIVLANLSILFVGLICCSCSGIKLEPEVAQQHTATQPFQSTEPSKSVTPASPTQTQSSQSGLTEDQGKILQSLEKVADFPLYSMHFRGDYKAVIPKESPLPDSTFLESIPGSFFGCSLFVTLDNKEEQLYGRNFDWYYSPALLLFNHPSDGYESVSMVDIGYLVSEPWVDVLTELPIDELEVLLQAPYWPFDGMNEHGLVIGMAAVSGSRQPYEPHKPTIDSLMIMREILDHARTTTEALEILGQYNLSWGSGPPLHYLIADRNGDAVLVEFYQGEMVTIPNREDWHLATNHLRITKAPGEHSGCWRYDILENQLNQTHGDLTDQGGIELLEAVSVGGSSVSTQWSIVYNMSNGHVSVVVGRDFQKIYSFNLVLGE